MLRGLSDAGLVADAKQQDLNPGAVTGAELAELIAAAYKTPKAIVERTAASLARPQRRLIQNYVASFISSRAARPMKPYGLPSVSCVS